MTRVLDRNEGHNYKAAGNDVPEHLRTLEIERHEFVKWIEECQLLVGMKLPTDIHMYDRVEDPDSRVWTSSSVVQEHKEEQHHWMRRSQGEIRQDFPSKKGVHWFNDEASNVPGVRDDKKISTFIGNMLKGHFYNKLARMNLKDISSSRMSPSPYLPK
ncbi:hypothetical protein Tco_0697134 [Tanacetum coccineum]